MWIQLLILELIDGASPAVEVISTPPTTAGGRYRHFTPVSEPARKKKKKLPEPEIIVKDDVVIEKVVVDWAGIAGSIEEVRSAMEDEEKRLKARQKRARNKALILLMLQ